MKRKLTFVALALTAIALTACGETGKSSNPISSSGSKTSSKAPKSSSVLVKPKYTVTIKTDAGDQTSQVEMGGSITKPSDPAPQNGKKFYGWKNNKNGGQIWNFDDETLNFVYDDVELEPLFVPDGIATQYLEAELCPVILGDDGETPIQGATYSGGAAGRQFIQPDYKDYGATTVQSFEYYSYEVVTQKGTVKGICESYEVESLPAGATSQKHVVEMEYGQFVHYNYNKGNNFKWEITSSKATSNVVLFGRFSAEYGVVDDFDVRFSKFSQTSFPIKVNGTALAYGTITLTNVPEVGGFLPFQDFMISANVSLNEGANTIELIVDNTDTVNGTIASTSPCIDSVKLITDATISWPTARYTNLVDE